MPLNPTTGNKAQLIVGSKVNRPEYVYEKEVRDPITGEKQQYFPKRKQVARQLISIPFALAALAVLGTVTTGVFGLEMFIQHIYDGEWKAWLVIRPLSLLDQTDGNVGVRPNSHPRAVPAIH